MAFSQGHVSQISLMLGISLPYFIFIIVSPMHVLTFPFKVLPIKEGLSQMHFVPLLSSPELFSNTWHLGKAFSTDLLRFSDMFPYSPGIIKILWTQDLVLSPDVCIYVRCRLLYRKLFDLKLQYDTN